MTFEAEVFRATGPPRAQGRAEGIAQRDALTAHRRSPLRWWAGSLRLASGCRRLAQQIPQAHERLAGFSAAAKVPVAELFELDLSALHPRPWGIDEAGLWLARSFPGRLRLLGPDAGFATLEWLDKGRLSPSLGCNRVGLAGLAATSAPRRRDRAPSHWLLGEALLRFERAEVAADWCARRRPDGEGCLVFRDRTGRCVVTEIDGTEVRLRDHVDREAAPSLSVGSDGSALILASEIDRRRFAVDQSPGSLSSQKATAEVGSSVTPK